MLPLNRTHAEHAGYALLMMLVVGWPMGWTAGAAFGAAFFIGREHAQAEERCIEQNGGRRALVRLPEFQCLASWRYWGWDSMLDWICPLAATAAALIITRL